MSVYTVGLKIQAKRGSENMKCVGGDSGGCGRGDSGDNE